MGRFETPVSFPIAKLICCSGLVVRRWVLAAGARGAALRDRHQGEQEPPLTRARSRTRAARHPQRHRYLRRLHVLTFTGTTTSLNTIIHSRKFYLQIPRIGSTDSKVYLWTDRDIGDSRCANQAGIESSLGFLHIQIMNHRVAVLSNRHKQGPPLTGARNRTARHRNLRRLDVLIIHRNQNFIDTSWTTLYTSLCRFQVLTMKHILTLTRSHGQ